MEGCSGEDDSMLVEACVNEVKFIKAADVIDGVTEELDLRVRKLEGWSQHRMRTADCLKEQTWLKSVKRRCSVQSREKSYCTAEKRRSEYSLRTKLMGAGETWLPQRWKKAPIKEETMAKVQQSFASSEPGIPSWMRKLL